MITLRPLRRSTFCVLLPLLSACGSADPASRPSAGAVGDTAGGDDPRVMRADRDRVQGAENAPLWLVEVSDFQCPYCAQFQRETYPALKSEYIEAGKVRHAYVNLPLPNHQHARAAAEAAMCAGAQGRFWPMHDAIFATQRRWSTLASATAVFDSLATAVGVDRATWDECVDSGVMRPLIQADYDRSLGSGVNSTPSFLVIGDTAVADAGTAILGGAQPIENFRRVLDAMLARRDSLTRRPGAR